MRLLLSCLIFVTSVGYAEPRTLYFGAHQSGDDPFLPYILTLLNAVSEDQGWSYQWSPHSSPMSQQRMQHTMLQGDNSLHLAWMMTNQERENKMLAVPIPLFMGLIGMRVPLLPLGSLAVEANWSEDHWKTLRAGQLADWPDTDILKANGFPVMTASVYRSLFLMLDAGRFDYFPRSVIEIEQEMKANQALNIGISQHWLLYYPAPFYFFVSPSEPELAEQLHQGLLNLHNSGRFLEIFLHYYGERIERLNISTRHVLRLNNPLLPDTAPLQHPMFWWPFPDAELSPQK